MTNQINNTCGSCNKPVSNFSCGPTDKHCPMVDGTGSGSPCCNYEAGLEPWDICPCYDEAMNAIDEDTCIYHEPGIRCPECPTQDEPEDDGYCELTRHDCDRGVTDDNLPQDFGNTGRFSDW